jgi:NAD(P)-dependent dehydrogenase (short-subunit alcohol dehydrogenase family)
MQKLQELSPDSASSAEPLLIDISSDDSIAAAFSLAQERFGYIDVLVNNAGIYNFPPLYPWDSRTKDLLGADLDTAVSSGRLTKREA